ncbi:MAG: hypothetical protein AAB917_00795 [Patescibacteria group bacterium]
MITSTVLQINTFQTIISAGVSAVMVVIALFLKEYLDKKTSKRNYIIDKSYAIHERLRDNLRGMLQDIGHSYYFLLKKVTKEDKSNVNMSYGTYELKSTKDVFSSFNEVTSYQQEFEYFRDTLLQDILKVSKLSIPRVQKIATKIEALYSQTMAGEEVLQDLFQDELQPRMTHFGYKLSETEKSYTKFIQEAHKKIFLIEAQKLLQKLEKEIERVVKLRL